MQRATGRLVEAREAAAVVSVALMAEIVAVSDEARPARVAEREAEAWRAIGASQELRPLRHSMRFISNFTRLLNLHDARANAWSCAHRAWRGGGAFWKRAWLGAGRPPSPHCYHHCHCHWRGPPCSAARSRGGSRHQTHQTSRLRPVVVQTRTAECNF